MLQSDSDGEQTDRHRDVRTNRKLQKF